MASRDYKPNCDVLSISSYSSDSKDAQTPNGGYGSDTEDLWMSYIVTPTVDEQSYPRIDPNDPLRYFLERGEITPNEYERWKLVREEPEPRPQSHSHSKKRNDFGPGYNSDSDEDDDGDSIEGTVTTEYGTGYSVHADEYNDPFDPWNPTPDPTHNRRYTKLANDGEFMLKQLTQGRKLSDAFELKLAWERFKSSSSPTHQLQTLQDFWLEHALQIYEALQNLSENQARVQGNPEYHSTPFETLENTFETIGRMSRCIAEDFNTPSVVAYVEEFLVTLYREIEFIALVEEHDTKMREQQQ
jgi:hypothetical protein